MKDSVQCNPVYEFKKIWPLAGLELGTTRSLGQSFIHRVTGTPHVDEKHPFV